SLLLIFAGGVTVWNWLNRPAEGAAPVPEVKPDEGVLTPHAVTNRVGEQVKVEIRVARIERQRDGVTYIYANDPELKDEEFRLLIPFAIPKDLMTALNQRGLLKAGKAGGQKIKVSGTLTRDGDVSEIVVQYLNQIIE